MFFYIAAVIFIFGLLTGSFLNLCVYRLPKGQSVNSPDSYCEKCGISLKLHDVLPLISYIKTRGRCRYCNSKISIVHPLFEILVGTIFVCIYLVTGLSFKLLIYLILASVLILAFIIDIKHRIIPNKIILIGLAAGGALTIYNAISSEPWINNLLGCLIGFVIFLFCDLMSLLIFKKYGMGGGDIKLIAVIGLILGSRLIISIIFVSTILAALVSIFLLLSKKLKRQDSIPYGPFMVLGTLVITLINL